MAKLVFALGAPDPEMEAIEMLLTECWVPYVYATVDGQRVHAGNAYLADVPIVPTGTKVYAVECINTLPDGWRRIDHHRPGDPGFGRPPAEFFEASSIGQVISALGQHVDYPTTWARVSVSRHPHWCGHIERDTLGYVARTTSSPGDPGDDNDDTATATRIPGHIVMVAAADHCLGAAYAGKCPAVAPIELGKFRATERARYQDRAVCDVLADIESTSQALLCAPMVILHTDSYVATVDCESSVYCSCDACMSRVYGARDMRRDPPWPELPEAATRAGVSYISGPLDCPDGRKKITCSGSAEAIDAFIRQWGPANGLTGIYGDPVRGFAGGYL